jgi:hypothetical protein
MDLAIGRMHSSGTSLAEPDPDASYVDDPVARSRLDRRRDA